MIDIKYFMEMCFWLVIGFILAIVFCFIIFCVYMDKRKQGGKAHKKRRHKKVNNKVKIDTYTKAATTLVLVHGLTMVTMSYVLAWFEKDAVVDVSTTLITEIVAPLCLYMGTNCLMNIFEKNELSFSKPIHMQQVREIWDKVHEDMEMEDETGDNAAG